MMDAIIEMKNLCVSLGLPGVDGVRPNVMVVQSGGDAIYAQVLTFARSASGAEWRIGCGADLPDSWGRFNPKREDGSLMWYLVAGV
jgi:hypothetical protein